VGFWARAGWAALAVRGRLGQTLDAKVTLGHMPWDPERRRIIPT